MNEYQNQNTNCCGNQQSPIPGIPAATPLDYSFETPGSHVRVIVKDKELPPESPYVAACQRELNPVLGIAGSKERNLLVVRIQRVVARLLEYIKQDKDIRAAFSPVSEKEDALNGVREVVSKYLNLQVHFDSIGKRLNEGDKRVSEVLGIDCRTTGTLAERVGSIYNMLVQTMKDVQQQKVSGAEVPLSQLREQAKKQRDELRLVHYALIKGQDVLHEQTGRGVTLFKTGLGERIAELFNALIQERKLNSAVGSAEREDLKRQITRLTERNKSLESENRVVQQLNASQFEQLRLVSEALTKAGFHFSIEGNASTAAQTRAALAALESAQGARATLNRLNENQQKQLREISGALELGGFPILTHTDTLGQVRAAVEQANNSQIYVDSCDQSHKVLDAAGVRSGGMVFRRIERLIEQIRTSLSGLKSDTFKQRLTESPQIVSAVTLLVNRSNAQGDTLAAIKNSSDL